MTIVMSIAVLLGPAAILLFTVLRATALFASVRRLFDGGEEVVRPVMDRLAVSRGSKSVSLILDLEDLTEEEGSVAFVRRFLAQRYRNLELLVLCGTRGIPTELSLAFDLSEVGTTGTVTIHRSRRDDRLACLVAVGGDADSTARWNAAIGAAAGELVFPLDGRWKLRPIAVAELVAPWVRTPRIAAAFGVVHPRTTGRLDTGDLVSTRADLIATAGLGSGTSMHSALGALAAGHEGCIAAIFRRDALEQLGGLPGPIQDPATWTELGHRLRTDAESRHLRHEVHVVSKPLGLTTNTGRVRLGSVATGPDDSVVTRLIRSVLAASDRMIYVVAFSLVAAVIGQLMGTVPSDVFWIAASAPLLLLTVVVLGLMMDDRAIRPVGSTTARLSLLVGGVAAAFWGTIGSPLRRPAREFHRA